jgi:Tfp pilus assembly protein PilN
VRAVNLLPDQHRRGPRQGAPTGGAYVVVGVLAALLLMAVVYTFTANQANSRKTEAAEAAQEAQQLEARAKALGSYGNFSQIKVTRTASVKQLSSSRFDWERMLRELASVLPAGGWLKEASASVTGDPSTGATGAAPAPSSPPPTGGSSTASTGTSAAAGTGGAQPSLKLVGCAPSQSEVAKFMVRLRQLYLVNEVNLTQSAKGDAATPPTVENCGRYLEFDLLVTFVSAAPTEDETPPGRRSVPARLGGGS